MNKQPLYNFKVGDEVFSLSEPNRGVGKIKSFCGPENDRLVTVKFESDKAIELFLLRYIRPVSVPKEFQPASFGKLRR